MKNNQTPHRVRSYVGRNSRITNGQSQALEDYWHEFGLDRNSNVLCSSSEKLWVEIGFGSGQSLLAAAKKYESDRFIGIETHKPGVGALFMALKRDGVRNVNVFCDDAVLVLQDMFSDQSIDGVHLFFPDPWQKRKHHPRRLIQTEFLDLICKKLKPDGHLHIATDWQDYADHIRKILDVHPKLACISGSRSPYRPVITKFEARSIREHRTITEFQCVMSKICS